MTVGKANVFLQLAVLEPRPEPDQQRAVAGHELGGAGQVRGASMLEPLSRRLQLPASARANGAGTSGILERIRG